MKSEKRKEKAKIINTIRNVWVAYPELRLGQLLMNVIPIDLDLYYITDKELMEYLNDYHPFRVRETS